jgi:hypothetical protein
MAAAPAVCFRFLQGACKAGTACRFSHVAEIDVARGPPQPRADPPRVRAPAPAAAAVTKPTSVRSAPATAAAPPALVSPARNIADIGANMVHKSLRPHAVQILQRAAANGVSVVLVTGTSVKSSEDAAACVPDWERSLAGAMRLFSTAGVHPHDAKTCNEGTMAKLEALLQRPHVVAVGETGLDFDRNFSPPDVQERWFEEHVRLAVRLRKPMFLHERAAHARFLAILDRFAGQLPPVCVHCFTGT